MIGKIEHKIHLFLYRYIPFYRYNSDRRKAFKEIERLCNDLQAYYYHRRNDTRYCHGIEQKLDTAIECWSKVNEIHEIRQHSIRLYYDTKILDELTGIQKSLEERLEEATMEKMLQNL